MLRKVIILPAILLLHGCINGPQYTPMTPEVRNSIDSVELYNLTIQEEIKPDITLTNVSGALGGGLLAAMIDSSINKGRAADAQETINPFYRVTNDIDYREHSASQFNSLLASEFNINQLKDSGEAVLLSETVLAEKVKKLEANEALLYLSSFYNFADNSKRLSTSTAAFLYTKSKKPVEGEPKPTYFNRIYYQSDSVGDGGEDSLVKWAENNGALYLKTLQESVQRSAELLIYDLQPVLDELCTSRVKADYLSPYFVFIKQVEGNLVLKKETGSVIRSKDGALYFISQATKIEAKENGKTPSKECNAGQGVKK